MKALNVKSMQEVCSPGKLKGAPHGYSSRKHILNLQEDTTTHPSVWLV